jgi:GNAT superfamily N-acetyltransferase
MRITCARMTHQTLPEARALLAAFLEADPHYLANSGLYGDRGGAALDRALTLFLDQPYLGFVWLGFDEDRPVAVCVVSLAISTSLGRLVAKLDDMFVADGCRGQGIGTNLVVSLQEALRLDGVGRIDTAVYADNTDADRFYKRLGFRSLREDRLTLLL